MNIFNENKKSIEILISINEIVQAIIDKKQILAIKLCRGTAGWGLVESKNYIDILRKIDDTKLIHDKEEFKKEQKCTYKSKQISTKQETNLEIGLIQDLPTVKTIGDQ